MNLPTCTLQLHLRIFREILKKFPINLFSSFRAGDQCVDSNPSCTLFLHHLFSNIIIFENSFRSWRSLDSSTQHLQISVNEKGGFARDDNGLRENNGKEEAAIRPKSLKNAEIFVSNRRFFLPSYTQKTCHPESADWRMRDLPIIITNTLLIHSCL